MSVRGSGPGIGWYHFADHSHGVNIAFGWGAAFEFGYYACRALGECAAHGAVRSVGSCSRDCVAGHGFDFASFVIDYMSEYVSH